MINLRGQDSKVGIWKYCLERDDVFIHIICCCAFGERDASKHLMASSFLSLVEALVLEITLGVD